MLTLPLVCVHARPCVHISGLVQGVVQSALVVIAVIAVPWMLFTKPLVLYWRNRGSREVRSTVCVRVFVSACRSWQRLCVPLHQKSFLQATWLKVMVENTLCSCCM